VFYRYSDDHAKTWSPRVDLTHLYKDNPWGVVCGLPALGHGIQLRYQRGENAAKNNRLIMPIWHLSYGADEQRLNMLRKFAEIGAADYSKQALERLKDLPEEWRKTNFALSLLISDDHGKTWRLGGVCPYGHECRVVELVDGRLLISMRRDRRAIAISDDGGDALRLVEDVVDLNTIRTPQGGYLDQGLIRYAAKPEHDSNCLIWSAPSCLHVSHDEGRTWKRISVPELSGYSCMTVLPDRSVVVLNTLFENRPEGYYDRCPDGVEYLRFNEAWLAERLPSPKP
jgi:sialidase-1